MGGVRIKHVVEWVGRIVGVGREGCRNLPDDRFAVLENGRCFEPHQAAAVGKVKLPADPHQRVTLLHQKTVAQIKRRVQIERRRRPVESVEHVLTAAVENIKQRNAVAVRLIFWGKHEEIGHPSHTPGGIAWSLVEIGDRLVAAIVRIERVVHLAGDFLVGTRVAKSFACDHVGRVAISIRVTSAIAYDVVLESAAAISTYRSRFIKYLQDMYALAEKDAMRTIAIPWHSSLYF